MPQCYRDLVGRAEVWRSLETTDRKEANVRCARAGAEFDRDWEHRFRAARAAGRTSVVGAAAPPAMSDWDLSGLKRLVHEQTRDARIRATPSPLHIASDTAFGVRDEETDAMERQYDEQDLDHFLERSGYKLRAADRARFLPMFLDARREGLKDLMRAAKDKDFSESPSLAKYAPSPAKNIDFHEAFEFYCEHAGVKGGQHGPTAKRWRPKIKAFCEFVEHSDLARMTTDDGYRWADHLVKEGVSKKSVRDVWIASLKATAGFLVERRKLTVNPFAGIRIRKVKSTKETNKKGFSEAQALKILEATLATPSHLTTAETRAARRWVPWICAYTGARVNEITSLLPSDVRPDPEIGIQCFYLRPEMTKGDYERVIPVHSHLIDQEFLHHVEKRRKAGLPLFYDPKRARGGENANPQWQKIAQRLGEWVVESLHITGVTPNHGWRHRFKSVARHVHMHPEVEKFITGHGGSDDPGEVAKVSMKYGDPWVTTLKNTIEMYPRYDLAALDDAPKPHRRVRRTRDQIAADEAARTARYRLRSRSSAS